MNNEVQKKKIGVVSYILMTILVLVVVGFLLLLATEFITKGSFNEYDEFVYLILFLVCIPYLFYYLILLIISIAIDLSKGKSTAKDITISIFIPIPIVITILVFAFLLYISRY